MLWKFFRLSILSLAFTLLNSACFGQRVIQLHAVRLSDDSGASPSPLITDAQIKIWVDAANEIYASANYKFDLDPNQDLTDFPSTLLNTVPPDGDNAAWEEYRIYGNGLALWFFPDKGVIYFRGKDSAGWSWGPEGAGATAFISMPFYDNTFIDKPLPSSPNDTLLAHELGHYLGLVHTFSGYACEAGNNPCDPCTVVTLANSDPDTAGMWGNTPDDDVTDTNPDPRADCALTTSLSCPGGTVIVNGVTFDPPWTNLMSYHDCLPETITYLQLNAINRTLEHPWRAQIRR